MNEQTLSKANSLQITKLKATFFYKHRLSILYLQLSYITVGDLNRVSCKLKLTFSQIN